MRLIPGRLPPTDNGPDRWRLPHNGITTYAPDRDALVRSVFEYRLRNNLEIGDIDAELERFYCDHYPSFCTESPNGNPQPRAAEQQMLNIVSRWISQLIFRMPRGGYELVNTAEAEARAGVCVNCPKQTPWRGGCGGCSASTLQALQQVRQLRKTSRDGNLSACSVGKFELTSAVWLPPECTPVSEQQKAEMPAACWRKKLP